MNSTCGIWPARRGLYAVVLDREGLIAVAGAVPIDDDEQLGWLSRAEYYAGTGLQLIFPEYLARATGLSRMALLNGYDVWVAPQKLVSAVACSAWYRPAPRQLAGVLARLPRVPDLRRALRRMPRDDEWQLQLFEPSRNSKFNSR